MIKGLDFGILKPTHTVPERVCIQSTNLRGSFSVLVNFKETADDAIIACECFKASLIKPTPMVKVGKNCQRSFLIRDKMGNSHDVKVIITDADKEPLVLDLPGIEEATSISITLEESDILKMLLDAYSKDASAITVREQKYMVGHRGNAEVLTLRAELKDVYGEKWFIKPKSSYIDIKHWPDDVCDALSTDDMFHSYLGHLQKLGLISKNALPI